MQYYYHPWSPNCRKTTALLDHHGLEAERILVDLPKGEHQRPEFLALNPNGMVPTLVDGPRTVWESNAVAIHLAEKAGSELWPVDADARLDILRWMFWEQSHFMFATGTVFFQRMIKPRLGQPPDEGRVAEALAKFGRHAAVLDGWLAQRTYLLGDRLSLADWAVASQMTFAGPCGLPLEGHPNVVRWLAVLDEQPAWQGSAPRVS